jgi:hypothetical protein
MYIDTSVNVEISIDYNNCDNINVSIAGESVGYSGYVEKDVDFSDFMFDASDLRDVDADDVREIMESNDIGILELIDESDDFESEVAGAFGSETCTNARMLIDIAQSQGISLSSILLELAERTAMIETPPAAVPDPYIVVTDASDIEIGDFFVQPTDDFNAAAEKEGTRLKITFINLERTFIYTEHSNCGQGHWSFMVDEAIEDGCIVKA